MPFFSIVIPTLNEEKYIKNLLEDLIAQDEQDFEIIVVDGNSEDNTKKQVLAIKDKRIFFITSKKRNVSYQRNRGAKKSKGRYIFFCDADSRLDTSFLAKVKYEIEQNKYLILLPTLHNTESNQIEKMYLQFAALAIELSQFTNKPFSSGGTLFIERNIFKHLNGFNEKLFLSEDHDLVQRAYQCGIHAKFLSTIPYSFNLRRYRHEGTLNVLGKYSLATFLNLFNINKNIIPYEMGGARYDKKKYEKKFIELKQLYKKIIKSL